MDDSRIYLGVVCGWRNEGGRLPVNVWRTKIFLQEIPAPYACLALIASSTLYWFDPFQDGSTKIHHLFLS